MKLSNTNKKEENTKMRTKYEIIESEVLRTIYNLAKDVKYIADDLDDIAMNMDYIEISRTTNEYTVCDTVYNFKDILRDEHHVTDEHVLQDCSIETLCDYHLIREAIKKERTVYIGVTLDYWDETEALWRSSYNFRITENGYTVTSKVEELES